MRRFLLIAGFAVVLLLLAVLGAPVSLGRSARSKVRARRLRARISTTSPLALERSLAR